MSIANVVDGSSSEREGAQMLSNYCRLFHDHIYQTQNQHQLQMQCEHEYEYLTWRGKEQKGMQETSGTLKSNGEASIYT